MQKILLLSLIFSLHFVSLGAQTIGSTSAATPAIIPVVTALKIKGKVKYAKPGTKKYKKIKEGAILDKKGKVKLKKKAVLTLMGDGKTSKLNSKGKHALANLNMTDGVDDDFLNFLNAASGFGGPGGGKAKRDTTGGGASGAGDGDALIGNSPPGGNVTAKKTSFLWSGKNITGFTVNIYDSNDINALPIFTKKATTNTTSIDLSTIEGIKMDVPYYWEVQKNGTDQFSSKIEITLVEATKADDILNQLRNTETYNAAAGWEKALRSAYVLQTNGLLHDAYNIYQKAMKEYPKNDLLFSSFVKMIKSK